MIDFLPAKAEGKRLILVGNGPSIKEATLGKEIDKFDIVVRFNNFQLAGYEDFTGLKTDIVCRRSCDDVRLHDSKELSKIINFVTYGKWTGGMEQVAKQLKMYYKSKIHTVESVECKEFGAAANLNQPMPEFASIGLLAAAWFAKYYDPALITIHGFDNFRKNAAGLVDHYFPKACHDQNYHSGLKEKLFIEKLGFQTLCG